LALFSTILAILTFFWGLEILGSTKASVLSMTEPLFTVVFAILLLREPLALSQVAGGVCILTGAVLTALPKKQKNGKSEGQEGLEKGL
jgi:drug/metabolite transporter (DMT)-like permease